MKISYYPGCTLKTKARSLEQSALASMRALGVELEELPRWNCCGAVHSLSDDDLIHHVAPVRDLVRVLETGSRKVVTLCSMCYNSLARANMLMREDEVKRKTINDFMREEIDYHGEVEVVHLLSFLRDDIGWDRLRESIKAPLDGMRVSPYYGCTLLRPKNVSIETPGQGKIFHELLEALGAKVTPFSGESVCCGSYQILSHPDAAMGVCATILDSARRAGAEALAMSCPLCEYNLSGKQDALVKAHLIEEKMPVFYFTELLAKALGLEEQGLDPGSLISPSGIAGEKGASASL